MRQVSFSATNSGIGACYIEPTLSFNAIGSETSICRTEHSVYSMQQAPIPLSFSLNFWKIFGIHNFSYIYLFWVYNILFRSLQWVVYIHTYFIFLIDLIDSLVLQLCTMVTMRWRRMGRWSMWMPRAQLF